uniref:Reverse transcriptase domain-containing protein n=1 Tax=Scylla olivacea TaxID=85551 RepID=A0A0P4W594_SCYOL
MAVLALDNAGAFDRVWHAVLLEWLRAEDVDGVLLELLCGYLQERHMWVVHNGQRSSPQHITVGVPQGSVLAPLLWNVYINDLLSLVPSARAYADDIIISLAFSPGEEASTTSCLIILRLIEK